MATYDASKPADNQFIALGPGDIRNNQEALRVSRIVDALTVMGLTPSNASGQIAINNGTLNVNLNADLLDGQHANYFATQDHIHNNATQSSGGFESATDKQKLDGIYAGAEVNQMAISNILVNGVTVQSTSKTGTVELAAGTNISIVGDNTNKRMTISVTGKVPTAGAADTATTAGTCTGNAVTSTNATNHISAASNAHAASAISGLATVATSGSYADLINKPAYLPAAGGTLTGAVHSPNPVTLTSSSGVLALTEASNSFVANGTEAITSITGWISGTAVIRWNTVRTLTHNAASLILQGSTNRTTVIGDIGVYEMTSIGTREIGYFPAISTGFSGNLRNLKAIVTSNTALSITADEVSLRNASNVPFTVFGVNLTLSTATTGSNGLDTGILTASTWYNHFIIYNSTTSTTAGLLSLSSTTPTLPSGYTYFSRTGAVYCDVNKYLMRVFQYGNRAQYVVTAGTNTAKYPIMSIGAAGNISTPAYVAVAIGSYVPVTASHIQIGLAANNNSNYGAAIAAPNSNFGAETSISNPPPLHAWYYNNVQGVMALESTNIYWASGSTSNALFCIGWEDNL